MAKSDESKSETTKEVATEVATKGSSAEAKPIVRRPFGSMFHPRQDFERFFDDFMGKGWMRPWSWDLPDLETQMPRVDVIDRDDEVIVKAELPGIDKEDVEVSVTDSTLTIKGSTRTEEEEEKGDYHRREIATSYVSRTVQLPAEVEGESSKTAYWK
jgi:HSP20 family protein